MRSHDLHAFDFPTMTWRFIRSGFAHPGPRYECSLTCSSEFGSAALIGAPEPEPGFLKGANLGDNIERDGGRYCIMYGGFNSVSPAPECWALSLEWESAGCGGLDPAEYELRGASLESLVKEAQPDGMLRSCSTPTLANVASAESFASSNASTQVRFVQGTKGGEVASGGPGGGSAASILKTMGVDVESIEKALMSLKREKVIASKEAAHERNERIRLEKIIKGLEEHLAKMEEERKKAVEGFREERDQLRGTIERQKGSIASLKVRISEQEELMLKMDMARIQEAGVLRHAAGAKAEMMVDFAQETVMEHELVRIRHDVDCACQVEVEEIGGGGVALEDIKKREERERLEKEKKELEEWMKRKKLHEGEDVVVVQAMRGRELAPGDDILSNSPRKVAGGASRRTFNAGLSAAGTSTARSQASRPLSVRILEPTEMANADMTATSVMHALEEVEGGAQQDATTAGISSSQAHKKLDQGNDDEPPSRPTSREDTARVTLVEGYTEPHPVRRSSSNESSEGQTATGGSRSSPKNEAESGNPFEDAYANVPQTSSRKPPQEILETSRTGVSEISCNINNGNPASACTTPVSKKEPVMPAANRVRDAAAAAIQGELAYYILAKCALFSFASPPPSMFSQPFLNRLGSTFCTS